MKKLDLRRIATVLDGFYVEEIGVRLAHVEAPRHPRSLSADREKDFAKIESEYCAQIDASILAWTGAGSLPELPPHAKAWRRQRLLIAVLFLWLLSEGALRIPKKIRDIASDIELVRWLLIDRWYRKGRSELAREKGMNRSDR